ncbi:MAG: endonuclease [Bacteroidia bacterium]|nr:endonuclease [Bacteroidia bacterium]
MTIFRFTSLLILFLVFKTSVFSQSSEKEITFMFYNTENFFDTIDDPNKNDNEFLPSDKHNWNSEKYFSKINHLAAVIDSVGGKGFPALIGMCEVENETAVGDLIKYSVLKKVGYDFKVTNSPDIRSIDVALLYDKKLFKLLSFKEVSATNPELPENKTRNILFATLLFNKKERVHVFVNHWPSMRDGEENSEPRRVYAATQLRKQIDSIKKAEPLAKIFVMGDFNETPDKEGIYKTLEAKGQDSVLKNNSASVLINPFYNLSKTGKGTHYYQKEWAVLDQLMFSFPVLNSEKGLRYTSGSADRFYNPMVLFTAQKSGETFPNRTYSGTKYHNGYSDHLAVFIKLKY